MDLLDRNASPEYALQCIKWCLDHDEIDALSEHLKFHIERLSEAQDEIANLLFDCVTSSKPKSLRTMLLYIDDALMETTSSKGGKSLVDKLLCQGIEQGQQKIVENLLQRGADENSSYHGKPILHVAVISGALDVAETLLQHGADIKAKDRRGDSILHTVIVSQQENKVNTVRWLVDKGVDIHEKSSSGKSALHLAAGHSAEVCSLLLQLGCDVNIEDEVNRDTPMHVACALSCQEVICKLVQYGAKFNKINKQGQTPLAKLLQFAQGHNDFHSRTRVRIARSLIQIGFRMFETKPLNTVKCKSQRKGRNKVYDTYLTVLGTLSSVPSLQSLSRVVVMDTLNSGVKVRQYVTEMDIPANLKNYLLFQEADFLNLR